MGRPPSNGAPSFRFHPSEVAQMESILEKHEGHVPPRDLLVALAQRFSQSPERAGKITVQMKQIWNWFQNKRYALRAKLVKSTSSVGKSTTSVGTRNEATPARNLPLFPQSIALSSGALVVRNTPEAQYMEFEARSSRDGAWYDVQDFLSHRYIETGNPEVLVQFSGFGPDEDEWRNIRKHVRQRSLPCEAPECIAVLPGDLILCFQEGKEQALYFDAHVLDAQRRSHDIRGCRCRFLVRFDHDQSEEIVPLRKICRRPETDYRLQQHHAANAAAAPATSVSVEPPVHVFSQANSTTLGITNPNPSNPLGTLIPAASTPSSVKPPVHVAGQTNNTTFGITTPNPSTPPVTLIPGASTPVSVEPLVHTVSQTNNNIFGITNPNPNLNPNPASVKLFPSPVLRTSRSGRHLFGTSAPTSSVIVTPMSISAQTQAVTAPAGTAPPGFTPLSTSVQAPPVGLGISTVATVPVFPASLTPPASFSEQNKVQNDNPAQLPVFAQKVEINHPVSIFNRIKLENDDPAPIPDSNSGERVNLVTSTSYDEARPHAYFTIPVEVTTVIEAKKVENSDPKTPDVHLSGNPAILVPGQEQTERNGTEKMKEL